MNANSEFLSHLRLSSEIVKDWPSWKTEMWPAQKNNESKHVPVKAPIQNLQFPAAITNQK